MIETALVYIRRADDTKRFVGCGAVVVGDYIATCRHVWRDAASRADATRPDEDVVIIEYPRERNQATRTTIAVLADPCPPSGDDPEPDLVLLRATNDIPPQVLRLLPASADRFQTGQASPSRACRAVMRHGRTRCNR